MRTTYVSALVVVALVIVHGAAAAGGVTLVSPPAGSAVRGVLSLRAEAPADTSEVRFLWSSDGTAWETIAVDVDAGDGWQGRWDTGPLEGWVFVRAVTPGGGRATIRLRVDNTPPDLHVRVARSLFSPN